MSNQGIQKRWSFGYPYKKHRDKGKDEGGFRIYLTLLFTDSMRVGIGVTVGGKT